MGAKADLRVGDFLSAGFRSNYRPEVVMNHIYFTAPLSQQAFENDPNVTDKKFPVTPPGSTAAGNHSRSSARWPDWTRQTPEALQAWRDRLAAIRADERGEIIN